MVRVFVAGMGAVSPLGNTWEDTKQALYAGKSGITTFNDRFDPHSLDVYNEREIELDGIKVVVLVPAKASLEHIANAAGLVKNFQLDDHIDQPAARKWKIYFDISAQYTLAAAVEAMGSVPGFLEKYLCLNPKEREHYADDLGVYIGTGQGGISTWEKGYLRFMHKGNVLRLDPKYIPGLMANSPTCVVADALGARGGGDGAVGACAGGLIGLKNGYLAVKHGYQPWALGGGVEAPITPNTVAHFAMMQALAKPNYDSPEEASRPYDKGRSGFVIAEGAAVVLFVSEEKVKELGLPVLAEVIGFGSSFDAYSQFSPDPKGKGMELALERTIYNARRFIGIGKEDIGIINPHGTSTELNDKYESQAIRRVMGVYADNVVITPTKGATGHMVAGTSALEFAIMVDNIATGRVPPSLNLNEPDVENGCDLNYAGPKTVDKDVPVAVTLSYAFGGINLGMAVKRVDKLGLK
ncbi:MAG: beta-ketoacyl-[acyl-carrier-protein] synthase family protein [Nanoarchaeota archaeon]|nr:beta-ketoacyl-[acyl-carrier-protein] synthase family protein [Nanoarchaeota archaeon]